MDCALNIKYLQLKEKTRKNRRSTSMIQIIFGFSLAGCVLILTEIIDKFR